MTGTSRALRRLGVAGLSAVLATTGMAAFTATAANAANVNSQATGVDLQPPTDTATVNTCNPFTATVTPNPGAGNNYTVTVTVSQQTTNQVPFIGGAIPQPSNIGFCAVNNFSNPSAGTNPQGAPATTSVSGTNEAGTSANNAGNTNNTATNTCQGTSSTANNSPPGTLNCTAVFTTDSNGVVTFGVTSDTAGSMNVQAGVDKNQNGGVDTFEPQDASTKTWVANQPGTQNSNIQCTPTSATNPANTSHTVTCNVTTTQGTGVTGLTNVKITVLAGGPDGGQTNTCAERQNQATNSRATGHYGVYDCTINNGGTTGTDQMIAWIDTNNNNVVDSGEPQQSGLSKTWVNPAPANSTVTLTCSPNATNTAGTICQDPTSDNKATFTATVTNNQTAPASPASGVIVNFAAAENGGPADTTDTESLSASSCTTDSSGKCSVDFTDSAPKDGESWTVTASVPRTAGGNATASATKNWHTPRNSTTAATAAQDESRTVDVSPASASQTSGGAQTFTATVEDRFGNGVAGEVVSWTETGPGGFRGGTTCTTDSTGKCSLDVTSLSSEKGTETVTASLPGNGSASSECASPAGYSNFNANGTYANGGTTPNAGGQNNVAPGAPAGACSDSGTVNWTTATPPPPSKTRIVANISCHSPVHHRHRLRCRVDETPVRSGLRVKFKRRLHGEKVFLGSDFTNNHGVAHLFLTHLKSGKVYRVFAHVYATTRTTGATTSTVSTRIH